MTERSFIAGELEPSYCNDIHVVADEILKITAASWVFNFWCPDGIASHSP